MYFVVES